MGEQRPPSISFNVRVPSEMHAALKAQAVAEDRTLNGQIVHLLRFALAHYTPPSA